MHIKMWLGNIKGRLGIDVCTVYQNVSAGCAITAVPYTADEHGHVAL
jgi:hypothetical protein